MNMIFYNLLFLFKLLSNIKGRHLNESAHVPDHILQSMGVLENRVMPPPPQWGIFTVA